MSGGVGTLPLSRSYPPLSPSLTNTCTQPRIDPPEPRSLPSAAIYFLSPSSFLSLSPLLPFPIYTFPSSFLSLSPPFLASSFYSYPFFFLFLSLLTFFSLLSFPISPSSFHIYPHFLSCPNSSFFHILPSFSPPLLHLSSLLPPFNFFLSHPFSTFPLFSPISSILIPSSILAFRLLLLPSFCSY